MATSPRPAKYGGADGIDAGYASPLLHDGRLYVMSNSGVLHCFDAVSGKKYWQFNAGRHRQRLARLGRRQDLPHHGQRHVRDPQGHRRRLREDRRASTSTPAAKGASRSSARRRSPTAGSCSSRRRKWSASASRTRRRSRVRRRPSCPRPRPRRRRARRALVRPAEVLLQPGRKAEIRGHRPTTGMGG